MTDTEIANLSLGHLNIGKAIADLETENTPEARACRRFFTMSRNQTLADFAWPFATRIVALALVEEDPNDEWGFSYRYPSNAVSLRRILSGTRNDTRQSRVPYRVVSDDDGKLIYCDTENAEIEYTHLITNAERYTDDFIMALSLRLAMYIAPAVTGGDPFKLGEGAAQKYQLELGMARSNALNEEQPEEDPESEFIRSRN